MSCNTAALVKGTMGRGGVDMPIYIIFWNTHLDYNNSLLHDIINLGFDQFNQSRNASLSTALNLYSKSSNGSHCFPDKIDIDLSSISVVNDMLKNGPIRYKATFFFHSSDLTLSAR